MAEDQELLSAFYSESGEILERLEADLRNLQDSPGDADLINSLFRGFHTIKGNSSFLSLDNVTKLANAAENLLEKLRKKELPASPAAVEVIEAAVEALTRMIVKQETGLNPSEAMAAIEEFLQGKNRSTLGIVPVPVQANVSPAVSPSAAASAIPNSVAAKPNKILAPTFVRVDENKLGKIISLVSELELLRYSLERIPEKMDALGKVAADLRFEVDLQVSKVSRLTRSLSGIVFGVRLMPVNQVFLRFPKVVKELAGRLNKEIRLEIQNGEAELDKAIVEAVGDPMTHLIRNAADHGIESTQERKASGKPLQGTIKLNSFVRGNYVYIEITDDGRGIDGDKVLKKAIEKGIVPLDKASTFTESKKLALIFAPGFSMAEKITDISGRGVGMDVVKSNINKLKGTVLIESRVGVGTTISLRFPLSVVVMFSLFVEINKTTCAIAVEQINESMDFTAAELLPHVPSGEDRDQFYAIYSLKTLLWGEAEEVGQRTFYHGLIFKEDSGRKIAFIVDDYSSIEEAIVQSVDSYVSALPGIQGATIRKDGSVSLVLNTENLVEHALKSQPLAYARVKVKATELDKEEVTLTDFLYLGTGSH